MSKFCQCTDPIEINFFKGTYFQKMQVMNYLILLIFICSLFKGFQCKPMTIDENRFVNLKYMVLRGTENLFTSLAPPFNLK